jgi:hypothetical protein
MAISPNPNTLSDDVLFGSFLKTIKLQENGLAPQNTQIKFACLQELATYFTSKIGIPNIRLVPVNSFSGDQIGEFDVYLGNVMQFSTKRLSATDIDQFRRVMLTFYHELRHGEQIFRALQYRREYHDYRPAPVIMRILATKKGKSDTYLVLGSNFLKLPNGFKKEGPWPPPKLPSQDLWTDEFKGKPILPKDRLNFATTMADEYYGLGRELPELDQKKERDAYNFSREGYRILSKPLAPAKSDRSWYPLAFGKVNKNGYVDPSAGDFLTRIADLNDPKFKAIPLITSFKGKK